MIIALALLAPAGATQAGPGPGFLGPPPGALLDYHADELGLADETRRAIRDIVDASRSEGETLRRELRDERLALRDLMRQDRVDAQAVLAQVERIGGLQTELEKHRIATMLAIREQLSPEERTALMELRRRMRQRHIGPILEACADEVETICPGEAPRAVHCLLHQRDELSEPCTQALRQLPDRFGRRRFGGDEAPGPPPAWGSPAPYEPPR